MTKQSSKLLRDIFDSLEKRAPPQNILSLIQDAKVNIQSDSLEGYWICVAKAETENRLGLPEDALVTIHQARDRIPVSDITMPVLAELSKLAGLIHSWRPNSEIANFELLRSIAEGHDGVKNTDQKIAEKLVISAQLAVETGRYKEAITLLTPALSASKFETVFEQRTLWWKIKALNGMQKYQDALREIEKFDAKTVVSKRLAFLFKLEELVSLARMGANYAKLKALEEELRERLPVDQSAFEYFEFDETRFEAGLIDNNTESLKILDRLIFRYTEDRLFAKLTKSLIHKGETCVKIGTHLEAANAFKEAASIVAENQYSGLRQYLLEVAHKQDGRYVENNYRALFDEFNQASRYLDIETLGRGGQGVVVRALDLFTGKFCAIKKFTIENPTKLKDVSYQEIRNGLKLLSRTHSQGVLSVRDFFWIADELYAVTPLGTGTEITDEEIIAMTKAEKLQLCLKILTLVEEIHEAGLIHNDLKPKNILLNHETGVVEIIDFGISHLINEPPLTSSIIGTSKYMAPEVLSGNEVPSFSSDVYSLGVIFKNWFPENDNALTKFLRKTSEYGKIINQMLQTNSAERPKLSFIKTQFQQLL